MKQGAHEGLRINIRNLAEGSYPIDQHVEAAAIDLPESFNTVRVSGSLTKRQMQLLLDLRCEADGVFECTRCTAGFSRSIRTQLHLEFVPPEMVRDPEDENIHTYDPATYTYVQIGPDVRDALLLAIPMKLLCRADCAGICSGCGRDLNKEECICEDEETVGTWSALKELQERLRAEESKRSGR